jgi:hypothetical protein
MAAQEITLKLGPFDYKYIEFGSGDNAIFFLHLRFPAETDRNVNAFSDRRMIVGFTFT